MPGGRTVTAVTVTCLQGRAADANTAHPTTASDTANVTIIGHTSPCKPLFREEGAEAASCRGARAREPLAGLAVPLGRDRAFLAPLVLADRAQCRPVCSRALVRGPVAGATS